MNALAVTMDTELLSDGRVIEVVRAKPRLRLIERNQKAMNHMDPETKGVHAGCQEWGRWAKDRGVLGYPKQSSTEKAAQYGKLGIPQESNYKGEPEMPPRIAAFDAAISKLCQIDHRVIKTYYTEWHDMEVIARKCGMKLRQFQNVLRRARWRIKIHLALSGHTC